MSGCITTVSGRPYSEVVGGDDWKVIINETVKMIQWWVNKITTVQSGYTSVWARTNTKKSTTILKKTTCRKLSNYARKTLLNKPLTGTVRDQCLDDLMTELMKLRGDLNGVGNNFNKAEKKLHTLHQIQEFKSWLGLYEMGWKKVAEQGRWHQKSHPKNAEKWLQ